MLLLGDCREEEIWFADGSQDLILSDLPYGTVKGLDLGSDYKERTQWDDAIPPAHVFDIANRKLRKGGRAVFFSQEPYTTELRKHALYNLPFNYRLIWLKNTFANHLLAAQAPVSYYEDILVFTKRHDLDNAHPLRSYFETVFKYIGEPKVKILSKVGGRVDHTLRFSSPQFSLCTEEAYAALCDAYDLELMHGFSPFQDLAAQDQAFRRDTAPVFNLPEGQNHKSNVLVYSKDAGSIHPTQKPVALMEDLVYTFSNEGDNVLDLTTGYGSTLVACENLGRNGSGIEKTRHWFDLTTKRLKG